VRALPYGVALLALAIAGRAAAQGETIDGVAALVGGTAPGAGVSVILRSDVDLRARIALSGRSEALPTGTIAEGLLAATLDEIVGEVLIEREADRLRASSPADSDVARERGRIEEEAGGVERMQALLRAIGARGEEIDAIARRRAYVSAFLRANLEGATVVSDAQVERIYESEEHPFVGRPLEVVREPLRIWISQQALRRDVRRWIEVLRSRTTVRRVAGWRRTPEAGGDDGG
jgi:hypothetical protein